MNNKAHLRPQDYDSNGDIIPDAVKEYKGDLISREALKKRIEAWEYYGVFDKSYLLDIIDTAPTVEYPFYAEAYQTGYEEGKNERPQGVWIKKQVTPASCTYVCSECGIEEVMLGNFCCWCGAEMRKGGAE